MKTRKSKLFSFFNFFEGVDLTNDTEILCRRNYVIKNIVFLSNLFYSILLTVLSFINQEIVNYIFTFTVFVLTFVINKTLKNLIKKNANDYTKQEVAMYFFSFYLFFLSLIVYWRIAIGAKEFANAGYMLLFYSIAVVTLYQNKGLFRIMFIFGVTLFFCCHIFITYQIFAKSYATSISAIINALKTDSELQDIILRTIISTLFIFLNWQIVAIGETLHRKRVEELLKRKDIEQDFMKVVSDIYSIVLNSNYTFQDYKQYAELVSDMVKRFTSLINIPIFEAENLYEFSRTHILNNKILRSIEMQKSTSEEFNFQKLKEETNMGLQVVKRYQLAQKSNDILLMLAHGSANEEYKNNIIKAYKGKNEGIILLCETYIGLRSTKVFKKPYTNLVAIEALKEKLYIFFDSAKLEKFLENISIFEAMYDNFQG